MAVRNVNGEWNATTSLMNELRKVNNNNKIIIKKREKEIGYDLYLHLSYDRAPLEFLTLRSSVDDDS